MTHTEKLIAEVLELDAANRPHKTEETVWLSHIAAPKLAKALREALALIDMLHGFNVGVSFLSEEKPAAQYAKLEEILKGEV